MSFLKLPSAGYCEYDGDGRSDTPEPIGTDTGDSSGGGGGDVYCAITRGTATGIVGDVKESDTIAGGDGGGAVKAELMNANTADPAALHSPC